MEKLKRSFWSIQCYVDVIDSVILELFWESCPYQWLTVVNKRLTGKMAFMKFNKYFQWNTMGGITAVPGYGKKKKKGFVLLRVFMYSLKIHLYLHVAGRGSLPEPKNRLLSDILKWIVWRYTCANKTKGFIGKGSQGREQQGKGTQENCSAMWLTLLDFMVMGLVFRLSLANSLPLLIFGLTQCPSGGACISQPKGIPTWGFQGVWQDVPSLSFSFWSLLNFHD